MQFRHIGHRIRGFYNIASYSLKMEAIMSTTAQQKLDALVFWDKHGLEATQDAFRVSRSALFGWRKRYRIGGLSALHDRSRAPRHCRRRKWPRAITREIKRLRMEHPNLGPAKINVLLKPFCEVQGLACPSTRTIARIIADAPDKMRVVAASVGRRRQRKRRARKPKGFVAEYPGHCVGLDTVERLRDGMRRYLLTFTDLYSRFSVAVGTNSHSSKTALAFLQLAQTVFPYKIDYVLTDSGSEFQGDFGEAIEDQPGCIQWRTYPKCPKMNAHAERYNRTVQEDFVDYHEDLLFEDLTLFNERLWSEYLAWHNTRRPHQSLGQKTPVSVLAGHNPDLSNMCWHRTGSSLK